MEQHDLTTLYGERFASRGHPIWHDLPNVSAFDPPTSMLAATKLAGLEYPVHKAPIFARLGGEEISEKVGRGSNEGLPARYMLVRDAARFDPQRRILGYCGVEYAPIQNRELAEIFDPLTTGDNAWGVRYPVEAAGPLDVGESVFYALDLGEEAVGAETRSPERYRLYLTLLDGKDAKSSLRVLLVPMRVDGWVPWVLGVTQAVASLTIPHERVVRDHDEMRLALVAQARRSRDYLLGTMGLWADQRRMKEVYASKGTHYGEVRDCMISAAHPLEVGKRRSSAALDLDEIGRDLGTIPGGVRKSHDEAVKRLDAVRSRREVFRAAVMDRLEEFEDHSPALSGTPYAVMVAIAEVATWREGLRPDSAADQVLFGFRRDEMTRGFRTAVELVGDARTQA